MAHFRYKVDSVCKTNSNDTHSENSRELDTSGDDKHIQARPDRSTLFLLFGCSHRNPSTATEHLASFIIVVYCVIGFLFGLFLKLSEDALDEGNLLYILIALLFVIVMSVLLVSLGCQPQKQAKLNFKVPWVPVLPGISIFINTLLMIRLPVPTWYRFAIWMVIGFVIYFCYGMFHSSEEKRIKNRYVENQAGIGISGPLAHRQTNNGHEVGECTPLLK